MKVLIVSKESKYEWEKQKFGLTDEQLKAKYSGERANLDAILKSHTAQAAGREKLKHMLPDADIVIMSDLKNTITGYDAVIVFGGDNSFTYATHFVKDTPIAGVNSDPERSTGALCAWTARDLEDFVNRLQKGEYRVEEWARLHATINGEQIMPATSEYFFGEKGREDMSRQVMIYRGKEYEQKSSGIIIATGAGSTGWYDSASRAYFPQGNKVPRTHKKAVFVITEPYAPKPDDVMFGELLPGEELVLHSLNDAEGRASADAWHKYDFFRGKKAVVNISDQPLRVIVPESTQ